MMYKLINKINIKIIINNYSKNTFLKKKKKINKIKKIKKIKKKKKKINKKKL